MDEQIDEIEQLRTHCDKLRADIQTLETNTRNDVARMRKELDKTWHRYSRLKSERDRLREAAELECRQREMEERRKAADALRQAKLEAKTAQLRARQRKFREQQQAEQDEKERQRVRRVLDEMGLTPKEPNLTGCESDKPDVPDEPPLTEAEFAALIEREFITPPNRG